MRKIAFIAGCLAATSAHAQSTGIPWVNGRILTAPMLQSLDQAKMNINSLGKPGFAPQLNALGQITNPVVGDVSQAKATADGQTVVEVTAKAANAVQKTDANLANGYAKLDGSGHVTVPVTGSVADAPANASGDTVSSIADKANNAVPITGGTSTNQTINTPSISYGTAIGLEVSSTIGKVFGASVSRYLEAKLLDVISVKDFGAKGDGKTDDAAAINAAIAYAKSTANYGGVIWFPDGIYCVSSPIILTGSGFSFVGNAPKSSVIMATYTDGNIIQIGMAGDYYNENDGIYNLGITSASPMTSGAAIRADGVYNLQVNNIIARGDLHDGIVLGNPVRSTFGIFLSHLFLSGIHNRGLVLGDHATTQLQVVTDTFMSDSVILPGNPNAVCGICVYAAGGFYATNVDVTSSGSNKFNNAVLLSSLRRVVS